MGGGKLKFGTLTASGLSAPNSVDIGVRTAQLGNSTFVYVDTPAGQLIVQGAGNLQIASGAKVGVTIDSSSAKMFGADGNLI